MRPGSAILWFLVIAFFSVTEYRNKLSLSITCHVFSASATRFWILIVFTRDVITAADKSPHSERNKQFDIRKRRQVSNYYGHHYIASVSCGVHTTNLSRSSLWKYYHMTRKPVTCFACKACHNAMCASLWNWRDTADVMMIFLSRRGGFKHNYFCSCRIYIWTLWNMGIF